MTTALDQATPDGIVMPFVENGRLILPVLELLPTQYSSVAAKIAEIYHPTEKRMSPAHSGWVQLTDREKAVAELSAAGKNRREIAEALYLSEGTVKNYISAIYDKLQLAGTPKQKHHALAQIIREQSHKI